MKKILILILLIFTFSLLGCKSEKVKVTFISSVLSEEDEIRIGTIVNKHSVRFENHRNIEGLYYDSEYKNKYDYKPIKEDTTLYVNIKWGKDYKLNLLEETKVLKKVIAYYFSLGFDQCRKMTDEEKIRYISENFNVDVDYEIDYYFGCYEGIHIFTLRHSKSKAPYYILDVMAVYIPCFYIYNYVVNKYYGTPLLFYATQEEVWWGSTKEAWIKKKNLNFTEENGNEVGKKYVEIYSEYL